MPARDHSHRALGLMALVSVLVVMFASPSTAAAHKRDGRIAFYGCGQTTCQIYTVNPDGSALRQITHDGNNYRPDWSPDGRLITYVSDASGAPAIWIAGADGEHPRQISHPKPGYFDDWPHFTPDGNTIIYTNFTSDTDGGISSVHIDGTHHQVITPNSSQSYNDAVVSPDGRQLAFMRWHVRNRRMRIYTKPRSGGSEHPVTPTTLEGWAPDWAPNGRNILFSSNIFHERPNGAIYTIHPDGTRLDKLTHPPFPFEDWAASYSPTGTRVVLSSDRGYPDRCCAGLYTMRSDGSHIHRIPLPNSILYRDWARWGTAPLAPRTTLPSSTQTPAHEFDPTWLPSQLRQFGGGVIGFSGWLPGAVRRAPSLR